MTGHVQSASGKFLVPPVAVFTAICFPVGVQVEAAQSAKYPLQNLKSKACSAPAARAVSGANTRSTAVSPNNIFENVLPLTADLCISSLQSKRVAEFRFFSVKQSSTSYLQERVTQLS